jgi:hypothetical protein
LSRTSGKSILSQTTKSILVFAKNREKCTKLALSKAYASRRPKTSRSAPAKISMQNVCPTELIFSAAKDSWSIGPKTLEKTLVMVFDLHYLDILF